MHVIHDLVQESRVILIMMLNLEKARDGIVFTDVKMFCLRHAQRQSLIAKV